jgi:DNA-binding beta-propeller fold protein YncE
MSFIPPRGMDEESGVDMARLISILGAASAVAIVLFSGGCAPPKVDAAASLPELDVVGAFKSNVDGWDYLTVDPSARRVYVARSTRVMVFDADKGALLGEVPDMFGVHGVALVPDRNEGFATTSRDGTVTVFDLKTFKTLWKVKAGQRPDAILFDPASKKVFSFDHAGGGVAVIEVASPGAAPAILPLGGTLEYGATDGAGRVYVAVENTNEVAAIDSRAQKVIGRWSVAPGEEPAGLAIDPVNRRLFVGCHNKKMIVLDADSGALLADLPIGDGVDGVAFEPGLGLALSSNGRDGTVTAVREGPAGKFAVVQTLETAKGARTIAADPKAHRFFLPCYVPSKDGRTSFGLLVVGAMQDPLRHETPQPRDARPRGPAGP